MESISQFPLVNPSGEPVEFAIDDWGEMHDYSYDFLKAHRHHFYEIMFFEQGTAQHDIDFSTHEVDDRKVHFIAPDNVHLLIRGKESKGFSLQFVPGFVDDQFLQQLPFASDQPVLKPSEETFMSILSLSSILRQEWKNQESYAPGILRSVLQSVLLLLARTTADENQLKPESNQLSPVSVFKSLIHNHYLEHLTVEQYADRLHLSVKHLISLCKRHTGKTPLKLIQEKMISEAKKQLFYTQKPVKEIAIDLGFDDPANFSNYFKSFTGYSPAAYRESGR